MAKVILLTENFAPATGGIANYLKNMTLNLAPHEIMVMAPKDSRLRGNDKEKTEGSGISLERRRFFWPMWPKWLPLYWYVKDEARRQKADVILCGKALLEGRLALRLKKAIGISYAIFTYAMEIETWKQNPRTRRQLAQVLAEADKIFYINDETKRSLQELGASEAQLLKVWPGVSDIFLKPVSQEQQKRVLEKYQLTQPYILSVARLVRRKGLDCLIEAFGKLDQTKWSQVQLVIVGSGPEESALRDLAQNNYVGKQVKLLTNVPDEDLPAIYANAEIFALTPRDEGADKEGFGIVYLEAAAAGIPAIGSRAAGVPEAILDGQTGLLVAPDMPGDLALAITKLLADADLRSRLGQAGQQRAQKDFTWPARAALVKDWLSQLPSRT